MNDDVVVVGVPVYGGRVPAVVADALSHLKGNGAAAIALVVYGNVMLQPCGISFPDSACNQFCLALFSDRSISRSTTALLCATSCDE